MNGTGVVKKIDETESNKSDTLTVLNKVSRLFTLYCGFRVLIVSRPSFSHFGDHYFSGHRG